MSAKKRIKAKEKDVIIQALNAGVVPRLGLQHIQVGRAQEVQALIKDIDRINDAGSAFRVIVGEYGSGKTFFLNLVRTIALEKKLIVANADLAPDRRLHSTGGHARALYAELMRNLATRTKPEGGALPSIVERFVSNVVSEAVGKSRPVEQEIRQKLQPLEELISGYDFCDVIIAYWQGEEEGNEQKKSNALRWLRAEYDTKTEARNALGVRSIITDADVYDYLKVMSKFAQISGYGGFLVCIDELVNLYKLQSSQARKSNYEQILRMLNDVLQGSGNNLGILLGGTPEFLMDSRRGLYSYEALQSRLAENRFAVDGIIDLSGPVVRLGSLSPEELYVLLENVRSVFVMGDSNNYLIPDDALHAFMQHCSKKIGEAYFRTPRNTIKAFVNLLSVLEQNPDLRWNDLIEETAIEDESGIAAKEAIADEINDDDLATLRL